MGPVRIAVFETLLDGNEWTAEEIAGQLKVHVSAVTKALNNMKLAGDVDYREHPSLKHRTGIPVRVYRIRDGEARPTAEEIIKTAMHRRHPLEMVWA
jgi:predicted transcriptional regulator